MSEKTIEVPCDVFLLLLKDACPDPARREAIINAILMGEPLTKDLYRSGVQSVERLPDSISELPVPRRTMSAANKAAARERMIAYHAAQSSRNRKSNHFVEFPSGKGIEKSGPDSHFLYLILCVDADGVRLGLKAGVSVSPFDRLSQLKKKCVYNLILYTAFLVQKKPVQELEEYIHNAWRSVQIPPHMAQKFCGVGGHTEWFNIDPPAAAKRVADLINMFFENRLKQDNLAIPGFLDCDIKPNGHDLGGIDGRPQ